MELSRAEIHELLLGGNDKWRGTVPLLIPYMRADEELFDYVFSLIFSADLKLALRANTGVYLLRDEYQPWVPKHKAFYLASLNPKIADPWIIYHLAHLAPLFNYNDEEAGNVYDVLAHWLATQQNTWARVLCLDAATKIALRYEWMQGEGKALLMEHLEKGKASMRAKARNRLKEYNRAGVL